MGTGIDDNSIGDLHDLHLNESSACLRESVRVLIMTINLYNKDWFSLILNALTKPDFASFRNTA